MNKISFMEVIDRTFEGQYMSQEKFDLEVFVPELSKVINKYKVQYDPDICVPNDDDLADRVAVDAILDHGLDVTQHERVVATLERADIEHHVDFPRPVTNRAPRFERFDLGLGGSQRRADNRAGEHVAATQ